MAACQPATDYCLLHLLTPHPAAVLANSGEVFSSLPSALPTFDQWLNYSAGVNINKTIAVGAAVLPALPRRVGA